MEAHFGEFPTRSASSFCHWRGGLLRVRFPANLTATWAHLAIKLNPGFGRPRSVEKRGTFGVWSPVRASPSHSQATSTQGAPDPGRLGLVDLSAVGDHPGSR